METIELAPRIAGFVQVATNAFLVLVYVGAMRLTVRNPMRIFRFLESDAPVPTTGKTVDAGEADFPGLTQRGMMYDTGVSYTEGENSFRGWNLELVKREIEQIRDGLHCNAITIIGDDTERLRATAAVALDAGHAVWIQPRVVDVPPEAMLRRLTESARIPEELRRAGGDIGLSVGV